MSGLLLALALANAQADTLRPDTARAVETEKHEEPKGLEVKDAVIGIGCLMAGAALFLNKDLGKHLHTLEAGDDENDQN